MYKQYKKDNQVNVSSCKKLNFFCWDFGLFKVINHGRAGANQVQFEYYGAMSDFRKNMITNRFNELFTDRKYQVSFIQGNNFIYNYYNYSGQVIGQPIQLFFDYDNSTITINDKIFNVIPDSQFVCKKSRGNNLKCVNGIHGLAKTMASEDNPESPLNSWGYNILKSVL